MFSQNDTEMILQFSAADRQRSTVGALVRTEVDNGTLTYTELLSAQEPLRTMALEWLDGIEVRGSTPHYLEGNVENWGGAPVLLVHVDPQRTIKTPVTKTVRIPGTFKTRPEEVYQDLGNAAWVDDAYPTRTARMIIFRQGWPLRNTRSNGDIVGEVVEFRWLQREAARGADAAPGVVEMYEEMVNRPNVSELLTKMGGAITPAPPAAKKKIKSAEEWT